MPQVDPAAQTIVLAPSPRDESGGERPNSPQPPRQPLRHGKNLHYCATRYLRAINRELHATIARSESTATDPHVDLNLQNAWTA